MATEALVHALEDVATRLRTDSIRATTAAPKWSSHEGRLGRRHRGRAVLLGHALRSRESSSRDLRSLRVEQGPRGLAALCRVGGGRRDPSQALVTLAAHDRVDQLVAIVDVNGLGQSGSTMLEWGVDAYRRLAVREIPRSGPPQKLLERYGVGGRRSSRPRGASWRERLRIAPWQR